MINKINSQGTTTEFIINECVIWSLKTNNKVDVRLLMTELNIFENIYETSISGSLLINDSNNLISNLPIYGYELLYINFFSPVDKTRYQKVFRIYKVANKQPEKDRWHYYQLFFTSELDIINENQLISRSFTGITISEIAEIISQEYLGTSIDVVEPTIGLTNLVFPNKDPYTCLRFLASRAVPKDYNYGTYLYYEDRDGTNFRSLEGLTQQEPTRILNYDPKNIRYGSEIAFDAENNSVQIFIFKNFIDILNNLHNGMYSSRVIGVDPLHKISRIHDFNYQTEYDNYRHLESGRKLLGGDLDEGLGNFRLLEFESLNNTTEIDRKISLNINSPIPFKELKYISEKNKTINFSDSSSFPSNTGMTPRNTKKVKRSRNKKISPENLKEEEIEIPEKEKFYENSSPEFFSIEQYEKYICERNSFHHGIFENIRCQVTMPGTTEITVGNIVEFFPPSNEMLDKDQKVFDEYLSGRFIVTRVRHIIQKNQYFTALEINKDCTRKKLP